MAKTATTATGIDGKPALTLEDLYREHFDFVHRLAQRLGGPQLDAEDIAQDVFLVVARRLHTFNETSLVTTWLYGITFNVTRTARRAAWLRNLRSADESAAKRIANTSPDAAEVKEAYEITYAILDKMAPKKREAFILAEFEGMSCEEIARLGNTKVETVWSRLWYARQEFAERLSRRRARADRMLDTKVG